jgi:exonuclease III
LTNWIKKEDPSICCLLETHVINRNKHWLRVKGWKKLYQANAHPPPKQAGVAMLISGKVDFKATLVKRDKEGHLILIKGDIPKGNNNYQPICTQCQCTQFIIHTVKDPTKYINSNTVVVETLIPLVTNR